MKPVGAEWLVKHAEPFLCAVCETAGLPVNTRNLKLAAKYVVAKVLVCHESMKAWRD